MTATLEFFLKNVVLILFQKAEPDLLEQQK